MSKVLRTRKAVKSAEKCCLSRFVFIQDRYAEQPVLIRVARTPEEARAFAAGVKWNMDHGVEGTVSVGREALEQAPELVEA